MSPITSNQLYRRLSSIEYLERAADLTVRGKRRRPAVAWFLFERERHLHALQRELADGSWRPKGFDIHFIRDPKPRAIAVAPVRDRVAHTAIVQLMEPAWLRSASECDFACRIGHGTHRAVLRLLELMQRHRFALHLDVRAYFPSVDLERLSQLLARKCADETFLSIVRQVLESGRRIYMRPNVRRFARLGADWPPRGRGLPMGAVTSQLFAAHVYLQEFDHFVKRRLRVPGYVRYVDDLFLFGDRRADLRKWRLAVAEWLDRERGLRLKHPHAPVLSAGGHLDALGFRIRRSGIEPLPRSWRRLRGRLGAHVRNQGRNKTKLDLERSLASSLGHVFFG